ncbi:hypothetical protein XHV734_3994 [Xanthomonas hortorum pv. vitians]|nr:hypothetical protein XHV734_3994 [Xanthomonas hortorum pv. vitians]
MQRVARSSCCMLSSRRSVGRSSSGVFGSSAQSASAGVTAFEVAGGCEQAARPTDNEKTALHSVFTRLRECGCGRHMAVFLRTQPAI